MGRIQKQKNDCCGCSACASICPKGAITMIPDALGFKYPHVDNEKCVDCGLCEKVCQFNEQYKTFDVHQPEIYAFRIKDEVQLARSQSGAAFWTVAQYFIKTGGIVYGVGYGNNFQVIHKRVSTLEELEDLRGSKYVQSDVNNTFVLAKEDLSKGYKILFSGTACQIAGLKSFIGAKLRKNLYTVDIVCHGVPSPFIWRDYIAILQKKYKWKIDSFNFRDKSKGWTGYVQSIMVGNKKKFRCDYTRIFATDFLRENCYNCPYTNFRRVSDITISDFWGWTKVSTEFNDNKGVSLFMINSDKGQSLFNSVCSLAYVRKSNIQDCKQPNLLRSTYRNPLRDEFESDYEKYGYKFVAEKYFGLGFWDRSLRYVKNLIKKIIRK